MTGLGAGGLRASETPTADKANIISYCMFGATGLFSGSLINEIGPRYTLMIGAVGYSIYAGSLWYAHIFFTLPATYDRFQRCHREDPY